MNYLDLFSGIGGFALGAYWAGWRFDKHYFSEVDDYAIKVYQRRFPDAIPLGDIRNIGGKWLMAYTASIRCKTADQIAKGVSQSEIERRMPESERGSQEWLITGGFPCQDISVAGKGEGIGGSRSGLWFEMWRLIRQLRPRYVIAENVGAITFRGLDRVLSSLAEIGYDAEWQDIRASDVGAPHRRERIWIVAYPKYSGGREFTGQAGALQRALSETKREKGTGSAGTSRADVRNPNKQGKPAIMSIDAEASRLPQDVADTDKVRLQQLSVEPDRAGEQNISKQSQRSSQNRCESQWATEPNVGRVAHGVPSRVDRLKALGNSIVPQIAEMLFRQIAQLDKPRES